MKQISMSKAFCSVEQQQQQDASVVETKARCLCPLSSECSFESEIEQSEGSNSSSFSLINHLIHDHGAQLCDVELNEAGLAAVEADTPIAINQSRPRRSTLLIRCQQSVFLWSMESRCRADCEIQVSITLRPLDELIRVIENRNNRRNSIASPPSSPDTVLASSSKWADLESPKSASSLNSCSSFKANNSSSSLFKVAIKEPTFNLSWEKVIDANAARTWPERQEHLVSRGDALVLLYPTHAQAFKMVSAKQGVVTIRTEIEKM